MDLFQIWFRGIRICFLLRFVKKAQLGITLRIFFAGSAKPFFLRKLSRPAKSENYVSH